MKRGSSTAATTERLVEPTSLTTQSGPAAASTSPTAAGSSPTGAATKATSASVDRLGDRGAAVASSAPRSSAAASTPSRGS